MSDTIVDELNRLPERIKACADKLHDLAEQARIERERRDELIVLAVDEAGIPQAQVARAANVSQPHIIRILAAAGTD